VIQTINHPKKENFMPSNNKYLNEAASLHMSPGSPLMKAVCGHQKCQTVVDYYAELREDVVLDAWSRFIKTGNLSRAESSFIPLQRK
jgi:hypothetical protein